ncbi:MAG: hypothetical protein AAF614_25185 [Chloroflexota bacterium]
MLVFYTPIMNKGTLSFFLIIMLTAVFLTPTTATASFAPPSNWEDETRRFRLHITVEAPSDFVNKPVSLPINFGKQLQQAGEWRPFDPDSLHLMEVNSAERPLASNLPFQFDTVRGKAAGQFRFLAAGDTLANTPRHFQLYFDVQTAKVAAKTAVPAVAVESGVVDEGHESLRIQTLGGTYFYHLAGGGFSSLLDAEGNDWIDYHPGGGSAGEFRGIPNAVFPDGHFHPGSIAHTSKILSQGPIETIIQATTTDGNWEVIYTFLPAYVTVEFVKTPGPYWFQYEGTPGGKLDLDSDRVVFSDGVELTAGELRNEDIPGDEEWVYFADGVNGRSLFFINHTPDDIPDTYWPLDGTMTVFGFGREQTSLQPLLDEPRKFTLGLVQATSFADTSRHINSAMGHLDATLSGFEQRHPVSLPLLFQPRSGQLFSR